MGSSTRFILVHDTDLSIPITDRQAVFRIASLFRAEKIFKKDKNDKKLRDKKIFITQDPISPSAVMRIFQIVNTQFTSGNTDDFLMFRLLI